MTHCNFSALRREYGKIGLNEKDMSTCPFEQFERWIEPIIASQKPDPTAMVLSTVDAEGHPDSRVVLLKDLIDGQFYFYTNYQSAKSLEIHSEPYVALNFYWPELARQIRIRGSAKQITAEQSALYFSSRPLLSQLAALASHQSSEIPNREVLEERFNRLASEYQQAPPQRPPFWGGYSVAAEEIEFWQGRDNRLHDRIQYRLKNNQWKIRRLAP